MKVIMHAGGDDFLAVFQSIGEAFCRNTERHLTSREKLTNK